MQTNPYRVDYNTKTIYGPHLPEEGIAMHLVAGYHPGPEHMLALAFKAYSDAHREALSNA